MEKLHSFFSIETEKLHSFFYIIMEKILLLRKEYIHGVNKSVAKSQVNVLDKQAKSACTDWCETSR